MKPVSRDNERWKQRSMVVNGRQTSIGIELIFWDVIVEAAAENSISIPKYVGLVDASRLPDVGLSAALRIAAMKVMQERLRRALQRGRQ